MFKNFIIIFLFFLLCSLLIQKPDNAKLLIQDLATSKEMVMDGAEYVKKTFDKEFTIVEEKINPFVQNKAAESPIPLLDALKEIEEETWFNEK
jgi:hypothetical protein